MTLSHFPVQDNGLVFHSWKFGFPNYPCFGAVALWKWSLPGRARINRLEILPRFYNYWKHFRGLSLDLGPNEQIISIKVYLGQEEPECLGHFLFSSFRTVQCTKCIDVNRIGFLRKLPSRLHLLLDQNIVLLLFNTKTLFQIILNISIFGLSLYGMHSPE